MSSINFLEKITNLFVEGRHDQAIKLLDEEASKLKKSGKMLASKRLQSLIKKIPPSSGGFSGASTSKRSEAVDITNYKESNLVKRYYSKVSTEEVILNLEVKDKVKNLLNEWEDFERLAQHNLFPTNKILLYGPPGTGKTLLANAIARQLNLPLVLVQLDELISSFLGETGKNIRNVFAIASKEPVVLFLDEMDTIAKFRSDERELGELKRIVTVLLQHIDFFPKESIIIGATNHDEILDKAIWRRFPLKIKMELPDEKSRKLLFKLYLNEIDNSVDLNLLSEITEGLNGSTIFDITQNAKKMAVLSRSDKVTSTIIVRSLLLTRDTNSLRSRLPKQDAYALCQRLKNARFSLRDIEDVTGIPYTTLRDNLK